MDRRKKHMEVCREKPEMFEHTFQLVYLLRLSLNSSLPSNFSLFPLLVSVVIQQQHYIFKRYIEGAAT